MNERLKKIIFNKLYDDLKHVEIIPYRDSIWFIDRKEKYWYFEYNKNNGDLWWRYSYFNNYFELFSLRQADSEYVMSRWVEDVLNSRVSTTRRAGAPVHPSVEDVLNSRVSTTQLHDGGILLWVEDVLNSRISTTMALGAERLFGAEDVLNSEVNIAWSTRTHRGAVVEDVLSAKIKKTIASEQKIDGILEGVPNSKKDVVQGQSQGQFVSDTKDVINSET